MFGFFKQKEEGTDNHWRQFVGRGDSEKVLAEKAKLLAVVLVDWVKTGTNHTLDALQKDNPKKLEGGFGQVFLESLLFYIHFTDRLASAYLTTEQRGVFMDAFLAAIRDVLLESQPDEKAREDFSGILEDTYNERQVEYSKYKMQAEKDEGLGGTLFWEFEKRILKIIGIHEDALAMMMVHADATATLKHLKIQDLFTTK